MITPLPLAVPLAQMPALAELFRLFLSGKHLNRVAEPALWAELEQQEAAYVGLFAALGYELRIDARGFAWFHSGEAGSNIGKISRQLALLFMVIFDAQANAGKALQRFTDWLIGSEWLTEVYKQHQEVLDAEGLGLPFTPISSWTFYYARSILRYGHSKSDQAHIGAAGRDRNDSSAAERFHA